MLYVAKDENGNFLKNWNGSVRYFNSVSGAKNSINHFKSGYSYSHQFGQYQKNESADFKVYKYLGETVDKNLVVLVPEKVKTKKTPGLYYAKDREGNVYKSAKGRHGFNRLSDLKCSISENSYHNNRNKPPYDIYFTPFNGELIGTT